MNKIISINIKGQLFQIDEEAYQELNAYMERLKFHFRKEQGWQEIVDDFETRMFEMFRQEPGINGFITKTHVAQVIGVLGDPTQFDAEAGHDFSPVLVQSQRKRLYRNPDDRWLGGVCSGLGYYFNVETLWIRLFFLILFFGFGSGLLLYLILWVLVPEAKTTQDKMEMKGESISVENIERNIREEFERIKKNFNPDQAKSAVNQMGKTVGLKTEGVARNVASVFRKLLGAFLILVGTCLVIAFGVALMVLSKSGLLFSDYPMLTAIFDDAGLALLFRLCCVGLVAAPAVALVISGYRILFSIAQRPWLSKLMGSIWLLSLIGLVLMLVHLFNSWQSKSYDAEEVALFTGNSLIITSNDTGDDTKLHYFWGIHHRYQIEGGYALQSDSIYRPVKLTISKSTDSLAKLKLIKTAFGKDPNHARQNAQIIQPAFLIQNGSLSLHPLMGIGLQNTWRNQQLTYELVLPIGFQLILDENLPNYLLEHLD
jgi:phage shock protein PspC (stress-responsive transcriptional regulator)